MSYPITESEERVLRTIHTMTITRSGYYEGLTLSQEPEHSCRGCGLLWPCDTIRLLDERQVLYQEVVASTNRRFRMTRRRRTPGSEHYWRTRFNRVSKECQITKQQYDQVRRGLETAIHLLSLYRCPTDAEHGCCPAVLELESYLEIR